MNKIFNCIFESKKSRARLGEIHTSHGIIKTPAFVPVGTKGTIKSLLPSLIPEIGIQVAFVNTYHLVTHPGVDVISKAGGIHHFSQLNIPLMSDSGGFQVFSLAKKSYIQNRVFKSGSPPKGGFPNRLTQKQVFSHINSLKMMSSHNNNGQRKADVRGEEQPLVVKISEDGVKFRSVYDGQLIEFTPETSMEYQKKIGADLNMAFDECTYYPATHEYAEKAMNRTHEWLIRCIRYRKESSKSKIVSGGYHAPQSRASQVDNILISSPHTKNELTQKQVSSQIINNQQPTTNDQYLYGVIQGGTYEDLRKKSSEFVVSQQVDGVAIGGVSVGETKKEMREQVEWVAPFLPKDKPVHLLGVGQIDDIIDLVKFGIDTFDCVEPTRLARMGTIYKMSNVKCQMSNQFLKNKGKLSEKNNTDITRTVYKNNLEPIDTDCNCYVCTHFTKAYLHHIFKQREILGYNLATYHNLFTMETLFAKLREMIANDQI